jgi:hypothetical protein
MRRELFVRFICADQTKKVPFGDALVPLETYDVSNNRTNNPWCGYIRRGTLKRIVLLGTVVGVIVTVMEVSALPVSA